jgi:copper chaperone CopZ
METKRFESPALYGDHHVMEVRRILLALEGVKEIYASSAFHVIEVKFDPSKVDAAAIEACLREAGYLEELAVRMESGVAAVRADGDDAFRHTTVYETVKSTVAFAQSVHPGGRPLWPCPGFGKIQTEK